ncbi:MAG: proton-conducting transporter membrane subunit [Chloroflexota bacterium]
MILLLVLLPLIAALAMIPLGRWRLVATPLSAAILLAVASLALVVGDGEMIVLGRPLRLSQAESALLAANIGLMALVLMLAYRVAPAAHAYTLTLGAVMFLLAAVMVRNQSIASLLQQAGIVLAAMLIPTEHPRSPTTATHTLMALSLGAPLLLLSAYSLELAGTRPDSAWLRHMGSVALVWACALRLAVAPFHLWVSPVFRHGHPTSALLLTVLLPSVVVLPLAAIVLGTELPAEASFMTTVLTAGGALTVLVGSLSALPQRSLSSVLGHLAVADMGMVLLGLGTATPEGVQAALAHLLGRGVAITLVCIALANIRLCVSSDDLGQFRGLLKRAPFSVLAVAIGGLSLAGMPPTIGFASRFGLLRLLAFDRLDWALALAACGFASAWAVVRPLIAALTPPSVPDLRREPRWWRLVMVPLMLLLLVPGLISAYPDSLPLGWLRQLLGLAALP